MTRKVLLTLLVVGVLGTLVGIGTFSAFSSTTSNTGNSFSAGTVTIGDNDADTAMYSVSNQKPGTTVERCIKVTYTGSLDADVKLYASSVGAGGQYIDLVVTPGTGDPTFSGCTGFSAGASDLYSGTLKDFADTYGTYGSGLATSPAGESKWTGSANQSVVYRFRLSVQDDPDAQGASSGTHAYTWEARNQ